MREIKFRAWDVFNEDMFRHLDPDPILISAFFRDVFKRRAGGNDIHVMQFTGLKDKNGKEIYEGDVLRYQLYTSAPVCAFAVRWHSNGYWCVFDDGECWFPDQHIREVIGNIYENPELVK